MILWAAELAVDWTLVPAGGVIALLVFLLKTVIQQGNDSRKHEAHPTLTNIAIGTGGSAALSGQYRYVTGILQLEINAVLGTSGASVTGEPTFSLPAGFTATLTGTNLTNGIDVLMQAGVTGAYGDVRTVSATAIALRVVGAGGTYAVPTTITSTVPGTWAAGNFIRIKTVIGGTFA